ncbi:MAG: J domain-containing protein [Kiritimatiellae bacterium]|nr:J domain-containing protein [Kiritimatiellia bacterium]
MNDATHYQILGISRTASQREIKQTFRILAKQWHPDVNKSSHAADTFRRVYEAFAILSDPNKRQMYDDLTRHAPQVEVVQPQPAPSSDYARWTQEARKQADAYAAMPYKKFKRVLEETGWWIVRIILMVLFPFIMFGMMFVMAYTWWIIPVGLIGYVVVDGIRHKARSGHKGHVSTSDK